MLIPLACPMSLVCILNSQPIEACNSQRPEGIVYIRTYKTFNGAGGLEFHQTIQWALSGVRGVNIAKTLRLLGFGQHSRRHKFKCPPHNEGR